MYAPNIDTVLNWHLAKATEKQVAYIAQLVRLSQRAGLQVPVYHPNRLLKGQASELISTLKGQLSRATRQPVRAAVPVRRPA